MNTLASILAAAALLAGPSVPLTSMAQGRASSEAMGNGWTPIDPARLMDMRGGMELPSGLLLSFGIERLVYVNGELVASASLRVADVGRITPEQAQALADINRGMVVQVGEGNLFDASTAGAGLVIQNTLDGQEIQSITTLDVGVDTLGMLQEMNSFDALHGALIQAPGGP